ncbi:MAG: response regulator [Candidatus Omnitrophota bacterium]|nr:response regulator [Candidatus Omnitrophota bacterium]
MKTSQKILILEDDPLVRRTLKSLLEQRGYAVSVVMNGREGIEMASKEIFDLVISDIRMPEMNGIKAVEEIQKIQKKTSQKTNYMFITGYAEEDAPGSAIKLGVTDFLLKPFDVEQFLTTVKRNLEDGEAEEFKELVVQVKAYSPEGRWQFPAREFIFEKLITLKETNMEQNVYFANYVVWQGEAREVFLLSHPHFEDEFKKNSQIKMITHSVYHSFQHESFFGDFVQIKITTREIKRCSFVLVFKFFNKKTSAFLGQGWQRIAFSDLKTGKICQIPHYILDLATPVLEDSIRSSSTLIKPNLQ